MNISTKVYVHYQPGLVNKQIKALFQKFIQLSLNDDSNPIQLQQD